MSRKLASIQKIISVDPMAKADKLENVTVLGWHCVVRKGDFQPGEPCLYIEIDSLLPPIPQFIFFMVRGTTKLEDGTEGYRVRTMKIRGEISQGLVFKVSDFPELEGCVEGDDVTDKLGIKQWYPIIPANMKGLVKGQFPSFIPKTDETRVQNLQTVLTRNRGIKCYVTEKIDGTSVTYYLRDGVFGVCSRNLELQETAENLYWKVARDRDIENKLKSIGKNISIQGEIYGPGVQSNPLMIPEVSIRFFSVFDINNYRYYDINDAFQLIHDIHLDFVPVVSYEYTLHDNIDKIIEESGGKSVINPEKEREGVVIRPLKEMVDLEMSKGLGNGRLSFKAINPAYLIVNDG